MGSESQDLLKSITSTAWRRQPPIRIGEFEVREASNELLCNAGLVKRLRPLVMDVLLRLAAEPGKVVSRRQLIVEVWPRAMVSGDVLSRTIAELRDALHDDPRQPKYIETIPTVGYRLIAVVEARRDVEKPQHANVDFPRPPAPAPEVHERPAGGTYGSGGASTPGKSSAWRVAAAAAAVLALLVAFWTIGGLQPSQPSTLEMRIAAASPFISEPGLQSSPRFSPSGKLVAFVTRSSDERSQHIVVRALQGTAESKILPVSGERFRLESPVFAGSDGVIAYSRCGSACEIVSRDLSTGAERVLVGRSEGASPQFDIDASGAILVYSASTVDTSFSRGGLVALSLATGQKRPLTSPGTDSGNDGLPRFSRDGSHIAFFRGVDGMRQPWILAMKSGLASLAADVRGSTYGAAWIDEHTLVVAADWFGSRALNSVDLVTRTARFLGARGAMSPDINLHGQLVYALAQHRADIWPIDAQTGAAGREPLWPSTRYTLEAEFNPAGDAVSFISNRDGLESVFIAHLDGEAKRMNLPEGWRYLDAHWSSNGKSLYVIRMQASPPHVTQAALVDVASQQLIALSPLGNDIQAAFGNPDDTYLYYVKPLDGVQRLWRAPLSRLPQGQVLPLPPIDYIATSGDSIFFSQSGRDGLSICRRQTDDCEFLALPINDSSNGAWAVRGSDLYYLDQAPGKQATLVRYDLDSRRETWRSAFAPMPYGRTIAISPDHKLILVTREGETKGDLMITNRG